MVRVLPDAAGIDKQFDYVVPTRWADQVAVGTMVRIDLHGRRLAAWVVETDVVPPAGLALRAISKVSSAGPPADIIDLARWAAHRWSGRTATVLRTASPARNVAAMASLRPTRTPTVDLDPFASSAFEYPELGVRGSGVTMVRAAPVDTQEAYLLAAASRGNCLIVGPSIGWVRWGVGQLKRKGFRVHQQPDGWGSGTGGGVVIGARSAVWAPTAPLDSVLVLDEHDEGLQEERNPTWHARDVAIERARRHGAPCVLVSPAPSLAGLAVADRVLTAPRSTLRSGWPVVEVIDRRDDQPGYTGLFSSPLVALMREADRVVAVLNRKGRAVMLACASCGELVRTEDGTRLMVERDGHLVAPDTGETRPLVCAECTGTTLKRLRLGINRAAEELEALLGRPVGEWSSESGQGQPSDDVVLGTEAALHGWQRSGLRPDVVAFLDFDQELHSPRYRAAEQAMGLLVRGARLLGGRREGARLVVQTRTPDHRTLQAAKMADSSQMVEEEAALRERLGFPPAGALAEVSGAGAAEYLAAITNQSDAHPTDTVQVMGPRSDGRYLVRAESAEVLAGVLDGLDRPKARLRVAVDPPRV